ncbi:MAG: DUF4830 domain-containing protein [Ruminococcaceae bacterium]|nr:DUF4830 domain-containing protein [Oscillospiraceae bacterium]
MFIWSVRASSLKFILACFLCVTVLGTLIAVIPLADQGDNSLAAGNVNYDGIGGISDIKDFLSSFGWELKEGEPVSEEVTIPDEFDKVFVNYNEIQKKQGLDLSKYKRKTVTRYTFEVTNFEGYEGTVYANVIVYRSRVIGGDICSAAPDGFVYGFSGE